MNDSKVNSVTAVRGFDPASKVEWTAQTEVEGIKKLVQDREVVFAKHRQFSDREFTVIVNLYVRGD
jgi:hypothetical protein